MAYRDFAFPDVEEALGLTVNDADLSSGVASLNVREDFVAQVAYGVELALAVNTEKARSEFVIALVLMELRRGLKDVFGLFSGIELNVDPSRGLNGVCDFILTKSPRQFILHGPLVSIVEAKNDNVHYGYGQCIAQMVAAWEFNQRAKTPLPTIYGVVTTGTAWQFMLLREKEIIMDRREYYVTDLGKIMGVLTQMVRGEL
jgi:hypothetical protein